MPDDFATDIRSDQIAEQIRSYMQRHGLNLPRMAEHVGISRNTLKPIAAGERQPREGARRLLVAALAAPPPPKPEPPYADVVRELWGHATSEMIGQRVGVSGSRIRAIAKAIGLTGDQAAA